MKIAIVSHINQISPFAEITKCFTAALTKRGHEVKIIAFPPTEKAPMIPGTEDGKAVWRVDTKVETYATDIAEALKEQEISVLLVNKECCPDVEKIGLLVKTFTTPTHRSFLMVHNDEFNDKFPNHLFTSLLIPDSKFRRPPHCSVRFIQQGVPDFKPMENKNDWRVASGWLPPSEATEGSLDSAGFVLSTFAGKTNVELILQVLDYVNQYGLTKKPVYLLVQDAFGKLEQYEKLVEKYKWLLPSVGYLPENHVAEMFQASDAFICLYPETRSLCTSSALRFAIGCGIPTISNASGHCKDIPVTLLADSLNPESIKHAIVSLFANYGRYTIAAKRQNVMTQMEMGWPKIVEELEKIVPNSTPKKDEKAN